MKKLVVGFSLRIKLNYTDFIENGRIQELIDILTKKLSAIITLTFIYEGSVVMGGAAESTENSSSDEDMANELENSI